MSFIVIEHANVPKTNQIYNCSGKYYVRKKRGSKRIMRLKPR